MSSNYEQLKTLKEALSRYQRAKRNEQERKRKAREKRQSIFLTCVVGITVLFFSQSIVLTSVVSITVLFFLMFVYPEISKNQNFIEICRSGTAEEVKAAIEKDKWNVNMTVGVRYDGEEITLYRLVARYNPNFEVLTVLEQAGARVDKNIALEEAVRYGNNEIAKSLFQNGVKCGAYTLTLAVMREDIEIEMVKLLVQNGATNLNWALMIFAKRNNDEIVKFLVQNGATNLNEALRIFAEHNNAAIVKFLLQNGATELNYALEKFAEHDNDEMVKFLLQKGAKTDNWGRLLRDNSLRLETKKLIADTRPALHALTEQEIITAAKKYGFEIVAGKNEYKKGTQKGKSPFSERIIAREESGSGRVYFCTDSVCKSECYTFFSSDMFHHKKYSDWRNDMSLNGDSLRSSIRSWLSPELSGELLDRAVNALTEICY